uniref:Uncharacterized protein n=1 Tax=Helianthus annuus TaxID=4232 RepID=A0A251TP14_HELAN
MLSFRNFKYNLHPWLIHISLFLKLIALSLQSASIGFVNVSSRNQLYIYKGFSGDP